MRTVRCQGLTFSRTISHWPSITAVNRDGSGVTDPPRYVRFMANPHARLAAMPWLQIVARIAQGLPPQLHASNFGVACGNLTEKAQTRNNKMNSWWLTSYGYRVTSKNETDARRASFPKRGGEIRPLTHLAGGFIVRRRGEIARELGVGSVSIRRLEFGTRAGNQ